MEESLFEKVGEMFDSIRDEVLRVDKQFRNPSCELFKHYLQYLKEQKVFSEIPALEHADYTVFFGHKENEPDKIINHTKEWQIPINSTTQKGIRIYKNGNAESGPADYPKGKSLELYLLENGNLLECEVDNQMSETPMDPSSHTTNKSYTLTRTNTRKGYITADSFIQGLDILQLRDLFLSIIECNKKYSALSSEEARKEKQPEHSFSGPSRFRSDHEYPNGDGPYERPDGH